MLSTTADVGNRQVSTDLVGASFYLRCVRCSWEHHWGGRFHCPTSYNCPDHSPSSSLHRPSLNKHATRNDEIINIDNQGCTRSRIFNPGCHSWIRIQTGSTDFWSCSCQTRIPPCWIVDYIQPYLKFIIIITIGDTAALLVDVTNFEYCVCA